MKQTSKESMPTTHPRLGVAEVLALCGILFFPACSSDDSKTDTETASTDGEEDAGPDASVKDTGDTESDTGEPIEQIEYDGLNGIAKNPIVSHIFTADPSANVFNGRIYVYASHDLDDQDGYYMRDYHVFSSNDMVNWQDHGVVINSREINWAPYFYAPDAAYSTVTEKYYLYFPNGGYNIGVAVSDSPAGHFEDALGAALIGRKYPGVEDVENPFDPRCFVDDDGQAYLYFGGGPEDTGYNSRVIRLGEDMISLADDAATVIPAPDFYEASFMHKYNDKYYFSYSTTFASGTATIDYMMSDDPMTGFEYVGTAMVNPANNQNGNNHHSIVEYEGQWYIFYHNRAIAERDGYSHYQRSIAVAPLTYADDGTIETVPAEGGEVRQLRNLNPFSRMEAETIADQRGIEVDFVETNGEPDGVMVTDLQHGDWIGYSQADFGDGATSFQARVASGIEGGTINISVDGGPGFSNLLGETLGACTVPSTGGSQKWTDITCDIEEITGIHDLYLTFTGPTDEDLLNLDYFVFE